MAIRSSILAWRMSMDRGACSTWCCKGLDVTEWLSTHNKNIYCNIYYTPCIPATVKPLGWQTHGLTKHRTGLFYVVKIVFWMELEMIILNEVSQKQNTIWYHLYVESKKWYKRTYLQNRNWLTDRKQTYGYQRGKRGRINQELGLADTHCCV